MDISQPIMPISSTVNLQVRGLSVSDSGLGIPPPPGPPLVLWGILSDPLPASVLWKLHVNTVL